MEVITGQRSSSSVLNPNAPPFVPAAYRTVEDYSPEWWALVETSAWFRDYWLRECFQEPTQTDHEVGDNYDLVLPDIESIFHPVAPLQEQAAEEEEEEKFRTWELIARGAEKWRGTRGRSDSPKFFEKAPKIVSARVSPRTIQQPR